MRYMMKSSLIHTSNIIKQDLEGTRTLKESFKFMLKNSSILGMHKILNIFRRSSQTRYYWWNRKHAGAQPMCLESLEESATGSIIFV